MQQGEYEPLPSMPEEEGPPDTEALLGSEAYDWGAVPNLDQFFTRIYRYWEAKGFDVMLLSRLLNLAALGFTVLMSALLLLYVNWGALQAECLRKDTCDIMEVAFRRHPLEGGLTFGKLLACLYLAAFSAYWLVALAHLVLELRDLVEIRHFVQNKLGLSDRQLGNATWPEVAHRLVQVQSSTRLCIVRDLTEHDVVSRIMRKENYLIAMLNKGVLALNVPIPGLRRRLLLTKTLEWNLYWCVLDALFDDHFRLRRAFLYDEPALRRRFRVLAALNLAASPFMLLFLLIYFFMKNAERFYHHPSTIGARRWSPLAKWRLREFNELPHFIAHRLNSSHAAAERYIQQFPNHVLSHVARFVAFVSGSFAALLLALALVDERLLERDLMGRQLVWWVATVGMVLALSRAFVIESGVAFDPEVALMDVVAHTHYMPRHWRGRAHTREVQEQFESLFQYKALLFLEELASTLLTPFVLYFSLPNCAGAILRFVEEHTDHVEGVGDVCSLAAFDFGRHGNAKYGAPAEAPKAARSRQGKMEKSFLSFAAAYPQWEPPEGAPRQFLSHLAAQSLQLERLALQRGLALGPGAVLGLGFGVPGGAGAASLQLPPVGAAASLLGSQQLLLQGWLGRYQQAAPGGAGHYKAGGGGFGGGGAPSGIFASAELPDAGGAAPWEPLRNRDHPPPPQQLQQRQQQSPGGRAFRGAASAAGGHPAGPLLAQSALGLGPLGLGAAVGETAERVAASQLLLQSIYEEYEEEEAAAALGGGGSNSAGAPPPPYPTHVSAQQHGAAPSANGLPTPLATGRYAAGGPAGAPHAAAAAAGRLPGGLGAAVPSPRQTWARPGQPAADHTRQLSSELSVLSREPSAAHSPSLPAWQAQQQPQVGRGSWPGGAVRHTSGRPQQQLPAGRGQYLFHPSFEPSHGEEGEGVGGGEGQQQHVTPLSGPSAHSSGHGDASLDDYRRYLAEFLAREEDEGGFGSGDDAAAEGLRSVGGSLSSGGDEPPGPMLLPRDGGAEPQHPAAAAPMLGGSHDLSLHQQPARHRHSWHDGGSVAVGLPVGRDPSPDPLGGFA